MGRSVTLRAPAKVNLALSVGPPEPAGTPDAGMHPIASWIAAVDFFDELTLTPADQTKLTLRWADDAPLTAPMGWLASDDLAVRALALLARHTGRALNAEISITKRIPAGGGLGGGSSDAAACMLAANQVFDLGLSVHELAEVARRLGSDIPFFLDESPLPRPALVTHFGERIRRVALEPTELLLIIQKYGCHTGDVYREYDQSPLTLDLARVVAMAEKGRVNTDDLFNDLALPAQRHQPDIQTLLRRLARITSEPVHVSGSGSTLFLITPNTQELITSIQDQIHNIRCIRVRTLTGAETL